MIPEQREMASQVRTHRCTTAVREPCREQQMDCQPMLTHTKPHRTIHSTLEIDHSDVIQKMQQFHSSFLDLQNTFCDLCKERFPSLIPTLLRDESDRRKSIHTQM